MDLIYERGDSRMTFPDLWSVHSTQYRSLLRREYRTEHGHETLNQSVILPLGNSPTTSGSEGNDVITDPSIRIQKVERKNNLSSYLFLKLNWKMLRVTRGKKYFHISRIWSANIGVLMRLCYPDTKEAELYADS